MSAIVSNVVELVETIAPRWMACGNDPVGLHAGNPKARVGKVLVALDCTLDVIREAKKRKCQMIVTHHPRFYRPLPNLDESTLMGRIAAELVRAKIALYCAHTNLDIAEGGINDQLADLAGLRERTYLTRTGGDPLLKLVVFVPDGHVDDVREAVCDAGAGMIGEYGDCSFRTAGVGTFRGSEGTNPFIGSAGQFEEAEEWRLETILPKSVRPAVETALVSAHPYEEPAYEFYELAGEMPVGCGRVGDLPKSVHLVSLARKMKKKTNSPGTLVLGETSKKVGRVAVWSGGGVNVPAVVASGADAVVCGEIGYHDTEVLQAADVGCIAVGHAPCECIALESLASNLSAGLDDVSVTAYAGGVPVMWSV